MPNNLIQDKATIVSNAQKFAKKGKIDKAIAQWTKLLNISSDAQVHNTIGDLYLKKDARDEALDFFIKAATIFKKNGFYSKATGIYNKILAIEPGNLDVLVASSRLNAERGMPGKAVEDFLKVSEKLMTDGAEAKALETLETALSIFPADTDIEAKIGEVSGRIETNKNNRKNRWNKLRLFKRASGRAPVRAPEKVKRQRKKRGSFLPRAAVFVLVFSTILAVTFEDIERETGILMLETEITSLRDAGESLLSSEPEEGYAKIKKPAPGPAGTEINSEPEPGQKTADLPVQFGYKKIPQEITFNIDTVISGFKKK
jgi:tetratricopeptide (TPR) repeat protein